MLSLWPVVLITVVVRLFWLEVLSATDISCRDFCLFSSVIELDANIKLLTTRSEDYLGPGKEPSASVRMEKMQTSLQ